MLAIKSSKDGRVTPSICSKKDVGVVTPPVTAERTHVSFFCQEGSFFVHALPFFLSGSPGNFCTFVFIFSLILFYFRFIYLY